MMNSLEKYHSQLIQKTDSKSRSFQVSSQMKLLNRFLAQESVFLEVGPGDCSLSVEVAKHVNKVYAIDVSKEITKNEIFPKNFKLVLSDGSSIPVSGNTIDIAYSRHLMEHLHPDDAIDQLQNIYKALKLGGKYICITLNRLSGPHDISRCFDEIATGFHLKEYTATELCKLFNKVGFSKLAFYMGGRGIYMKFPLSLIKLCEKFFSAFPFSLRKKITRTLPVMALLGITIVGTK